MIKYDNHRVESQNVRGERYFRDCQIVALKHLSLNRRINI